MDIEFSSACAGRTYEINQKIEEKENEYVIKVKMKIKKNKDGEKMIEKMIEKQESPVVTILKKIEKQNRIDVKEEKMRPLYEKE